MAPTPRLSDGLIVVFVVAAFVGAALLAGPALAQQTTDDGMDGNGTMSDGTETMDDGMDDDATAGDDRNETMGDDSMPEDGIDDEVTEEMGDDSMPEDGMDDGMADDETATGGQQGFGVVLGLAALGVTAGFALYPRRG